MKKEIKESIDYNALTYDELSEISRKDHQEDTNQYDKQQNALCLVMIGGICFICGILFFILSFERKYNRMAGIRPDSLQFVVFVACMVAAAILLTIGFIQFFKAHNVRKQLKLEISIVTKIKNDLALKEKES